MSSGCVVQGDKTLIEDVLWGDNIESLCLKSWLRLCLAVYWCGGIGWSSVLELRLCIDVEGLSELGAGAEAVHWCGGIEWALCWSWGCVLMWRDWVSSVLELRFCLALYWWGWIGWTLCWGWGCAWLCIDVEGLGELCAGVEVVPGCVLMWRDWVSSVLGLRLCLAVYWCRGIGWALSLGWGCVLMWRDWVSSVLGLRLCLAVYWCGGIGWALSWDWGCIDEEGLGELYAGGWGCAWLCVDVEGLGEFWAGVGCVLMWRDWVSSVLGLRFCLAVYWCGEIGWALCWGWGCAWLCMDMEGLGELWAGVEAVPGFVLMWRAVPQQSSVISVTWLTLVRYRTYNGDVNWC